MTPNESTRYIRVDTSDIRALNVTDEWAPTEEERAAFMSEVADWCGAHVGVSNRALPGALRHIEDRPGRFGLVTVVEYTLGEGEKARLVCYWS